MWQIPLGELRVKYHFIWYSLNTIPMKCPFYRLQGRYIPLIIERDAASGEFCHAYKISLTRDDDTYIISDFSYLNIDRWHEKILDNLLYLKSPLVVDLEKGDIFFKEREGYLAEDVLAQVLSEWGL